MIACFHTRGEKPISWTMSHAQMRWKRWLLPMAIQRVVQRFFAAGILTVFERWWACKRSPTANLWGKPPRDECVVAKTAELLAHSLRHPYGKGKNFFLREIKTYHRRPDDLRFPTGVDLCWWPLRLLLLWTPLITTGTRQSMKKKTWSKTKVFYYEAGD